MASRGKGKQKATSADDLDIATYMNNLHKARRSLILLANASKTRQHPESYHSLKHINLSKDYHEPLLAWYGGREGLPWRTDLSDKQLQELSDQAKAQRAYEVWVSEIMLQQTQVATVIPYYKRWVEAFPTVQVLSESSIDQVNSLWKGLGYYSRASRLLDGAKTVVKKYKGRLPSDPAELVKEVEGIGPYTAGAIASIAYGVKAPTVDGNIQRVLCRYLAIHGDMKKKSTLDYIWEVAEETMPHERAGHWNQALMDLGATICTPKNQKCAECPVKLGCLAYAEARLCTARAAKSGDIEDLASSQNGKRSDEACTICVPLDEPTVARDPSLYPRKVVKKKSRDEDIAVCVLEWVAIGDAGDSRILLVKRPKTGLLAGLDEFPSVVMDQDDSTASARLASSVSLLAELLDLPDDFHIKAVKDFTAVSVSSTKDLGSIKHIYSHINATFHCRHVILTSGGVDESQPPRVRKEHRERCKWISRKEVESANISTGAVKIWKLVTDGGGVKATSAKAGKAKAASSSKTKSSEQGQTKLSFGRKLVAKDSVPEAVLDDKVRQPIGDSPARKKRRIDISSDEEG